MCHETKHFYEFRDFRFDAAKHILWRKGKLVTLAPKASEVLSMLLEDKGNLVERREILERVWCGTYVEEGNLNHAVSALRRSLGSDVIETVPKRGYRFVAKTVEVCEPSFELLLEKRTISNTVIREFEDVPDEDIAPNGLRSRRPSSDGELLPNRPADDGAGPTTSLAVNMSGFRSEDHRNRRAGRMPGIIRTRVFSVPIAAVGIAGAAFLFLTISGAWTPRSSSESRAENQPAAASQQTGFGDGGAVLTDFGFQVERAQAVALQSDGKILVGGWVGENPAATDFALARYNPDGSLDPTFDGDGRLITRLGEHVDPLYGIAVQPDGKIVAVGGYSTGKDTRKFCVVRYKPDGTLDASFNETGIVTLEVGTAQQDTAYAVEVLHDGKLLVVGSALMTHSAGSLRMNQNDFAIVRLNPDGSPDPSFGIGGKTTTDSGSGSDVAYSVMIQPDGKIVVAGMMTNGKNQDFGLVRYLPHGDLDVEFGNRGKVRTEFFGEGNIAWSLAVQDDGKIVAGGWASKDGATGFALARYMHDGSLDNSFNGNGRVWLTLKGDDLGRKVFIDSHGRIIVAGRSGGADESGFGFARFLPDGRPDDSFRKSGRHSMSLSLPVEVHGAVLTSDGYVISVGSAGNKRASDFAIARSAVR